MANCLDMPYESRDLDIALLFSCTGSLRTTSAQETWFDLVIGILLFLALLGFGSTWDDPDFELSMEDPNTLLRQLDVLDRPIIEFGRVTGMNDLSLSGFGSSQGSVFFRSNLSS